MKNENHRLLAGLPPPRIMTQPFIKEQLNERGVDISTGQINSAWNFGINIRLWLKL